MFYPVVGVISEGCIAATLMFDARCERKFLEIYTATAIIFNCSTVNTVDVRMRAHPFLKGWGHQNRIFDGSSHENAFEPCPESQP